MKNILMLIGITIINFNALAQPNLKAVIEFEESTIDYGTIEKVQMAYEFLNLSTLETSRL